MALAAFRTLAVMVAETAIVRRRMTRANWREYVELHAPPEVAEVLAAPGQGLIVASGHIGNWEVADRTGGLVKPTLAVYRPLNNSYLGPAVRGHRGAEA